MIRCRYNRVSTWVSRFTFRHNINRHDAFGASPLAVSVLPLECFTLNPPVFFFHIKINIHLSTVFMLALLPVHVLGLSLGRS